ncbi:MAG: dTDP-4-dehydrorhamnose reductase [Candidatus Omnitrophica bacterium]|jgi:dTDP-4-dehydrorhamnose reductase|nr:dTDP-4-dehydrorhamnose reductase [Candidatus Omnitrophota bacterium]
MIWLIGSKGMLGKEIHEMLKKENLEFVSSDIDIDITDYEQIKKFSINKHIDWIINCAAYTAVDKAEQEESIAYKINVEGPLNLAQLANEIECKLIHFSTDYVFDGKKNEPYQETDKTNPLSVYGKTKLQGEKEIISKIKKYFIFRISWLYGIYGKNFVWTMLKLMKEKNSLTIVSDQIGATTYTYNLSENIIQMIKNNSDNFGVYLYQDNGQISWYQFAIAIKEYGIKYRLINDDIQINPIFSYQYPTLARRPLNSCFNTFKVKKELKFRINDWQHNLENFFNKILEKGNSNGF